MQNRERIRTPTRDKKRIGGKYEGQAGKVTKVTKKKVGVTVGCQHTAHVARCSGSGPSHRDWHTQIPSLSHPTRVSPPPYQVFATAREGHARAHLCICGVCQCLLAHWQAQAGSLCVCACVCHGVCVCVAAAKHADENGWMPLHYLCRFQNELSESMLQQILKAHPAAAKHANKLGSVATLVSVHAPIISAGQTLA